MNLDIRTMSGRDRAALHQVLLDLLTEDAISLGDLLRVLRAAHLGLTRAEYAARCGISERELGKLEADRANPTVATLNRLVAVFGLRVGLVRVPAGPVPRVPPQVDEAQREALTEAVHAAIVKHTRKRRAR